MHYQKASGCLKVFGSEHFLPTSLVWKNSVKVSEQPGGGAELSLCSDDTWFCGLPLATHGRAQVAGTGAAYVKDL